MEKETIDTLVRDLTKVGSISKSEARRRILEFVASQKEKMLGTLGMEFRNLISEARVGMGWTQDGNAMCKRIDKTYSDIKKKIGEEI